MRISSISIKNFRALEDIYTEFATPVSVIVGPNAIGKTTILEAIRLVKALLAPRTGNEANQALIALGAINPSMPQRLIAGAIARDVAKTIDIECRYNISDPELAALTGGVKQMATSLVQAQLGQTFAGPAAVTQFLSSQQGRDALALAEKQVLDAAARVAENKQSILQLIVDPGAGQIRGGNPLDQLFISFLDQRHRPSETIFNYFPADRALPLGEQPVQLGSQDASAQLESYNSQPQTKYNRLKNTIFSAIIQGGDAELRAEFDALFGAILPGRRLARVGINEVGLLSVTIQDVETGRTYEIDSMSSGEKGLVLTFLIIARSLADGGIVLLDEPELHLNPAATRHLLRFLIERYVVPRNLQAIVCSHSPEILSEAFERDDCSLYHLRSESLITRVRTKDRDEVQTALRLLGTSELDGLLYKATLFVEGPHDEELLQAGFERRLARVKITDLGGRGEVEKHIRRLQDAERRKELEGCRYFILDSDNVPAGFASTPAVRVLQWGRYCLENYLIDFEAITDILNDPETTAGEKKYNVGEVERMVRDLAMSQLDDVAAKDVYESYGYESPGLRVSECLGKPPSVVAGILYERLARINQSLTGLEESGWTKEFESKRNARLATLRPEWERRWQERCDGKRLFEDLLRKVKFRRSIRRVKVRIMERMAIEKAPNWRILDQLIERLLKVNELSLAEKA